MAQSFPELSHELLHNVIVYVQPTDLSALSRTCKTLNSFLKDNMMLCKEMYLLNWGRPAGEEDICWVSELRNVLSLREVLKCDNIDVKRNSLETSARTISRLLRTDSSTPNEPQLAEWFSGQNEQANIDSFLASSSLFKHAGTSSQTPAETEELRQLSAKLHCLYGVPVDPRGTTCHFSDEIEDSIDSFRIFRPLIAESRGPMTRSKGVAPTNTYARSKVYDLRQYTLSSYWGPFKNDGSQDVDWEKMEAIMVVLGYNLRMFRDRMHMNTKAVWTHKWDGCTPNSYVCPPGPEMLRELGSPGGLDDQDPYGIRGMWMRVVCFLDYHDLYAFNFARPPPSPGQPREPIDTREAIRMIQLKLQVTSIDAPGKDDGNDYPVVSFSGTSWSLHDPRDTNANSLIRGVVRQTPEGEIRWTTYSIFHGEERWRSEGVQVGGVRSKRGVLGNWFDKDFDVHGPAGPTAFWKTSDSLEEDQRPSTPSDYSILGTEYGDSESDESDDGDFEGLGIEVEIEIEG